MLHQGWSLFDVVAWLQPCAQQQPVAQPKRLSQPRQPQRLPKRRQRQPISQPAK